MANSQETNVNLKINRVPDKATLEDMVANNQLQPNQLYMIPSEQGQGLVTMQTKVLWENPSPTSSFDGQEVTVEDMTNYDYILAFCNTNAISSNAYLSYIMPKGKDCYFSWGYNNTTHGRECNYISSTKIQFSNGVTNSSQDNNQCIPTQIIGIKLIESPTQITNKYSIEETVVGEWIDGKKIYRKVVDNITINKSSSVQILADIDLTSLNIGTIVSQFVKYSNNNNVSLSFPINTGSYNLYNYFENKHYYIAGITGVLGEGTARIILEYTKTTD